MGIVTARRDTLVGVTTRFLFDFRALGACAVTILRLRRGLER
jgi:hypothetical protein